MARCRRDLDQLEFFFYQVDEFRRFDAPISYQSQSSRADDRIVAYEFLERFLWHGCQVDEGGLLSFNLALLDGGRMIGTR
jgi:hypothetical protein